MAESTLAVQMLGITKRFPGVLANDKTDFELKEGEVHALLGENGAGKSTLMNILYGLYKADEGKIYVHGEEVILHSPADAIQHGIGMVHQDFKLIPSFTVTDNIALALQYRKEFSTRHIKETITDITDKYELGTINLSAETQQLPAHEQQLVEIIKMLCLGQNILIFDEPTSVLAGDQVAILQERLRKLAQMGHSIVFISHKLDEVLKVSDRITVLRKGKVAGHLDARKATKSELVRMMVGVDIPVFSKPESEMKERVLEVQNLSVLSDREAASLKDVTFSVCRGEILGVAGVAGNGQEELVESITGIRKVTSGKITIDSCDVTNSLPNRIIDMGVSFIPPKPKETGVAPDMPLTENVVIREYSPEFSRSIPVRFLSRIKLLNLAYIRQYTKKLIKEYNIVTPSEDVPVKFLSGGNLMKLVVAREMSRMAKLLVIFEPTTGLDVLTIEFIHKQIVKAREYSAILLISNDLDELISLSDRLVVLFNGRMREVPEGFTREELGAMMTGEA